MPMKSANAVGHRGLCSWSLGRARRAPTQPNTFPPARAVVGRTSQLLVGTYPQSGVRAPHFYRRGVVRRTVGPGLVMCDLLD